MSPHLSDEAASPPLQGSRRPPFLPSDPRPNAKSDAPQDDFGWDEWPEEDPESEVFDFIRDLKDPEYPYTLEQLKVVSRENVCCVLHWAMVSVDTLPDGSWHVQVFFTPTVPHCHLATLIGLCIRVELERSLRQRFKLDIAVSPGSHNIEEDVNRQINDKERACAAMENPELRSIVEECLKDVGC